MQEVFKKIIMKLGIRAEKSEKKEMDAEHFEYAQMYKGERIAFGDAIEIVKQEAEKYNNGWIPCSERLPEDKQTCLVTARIYFTPDHVDEIDNYIGVGIDTYSKQFGWLGTEPIAWQPLPAPYQLVSNDSTDAGTRYKKSAWRDLILRNFMRGSDA